MDYGHKWTDEELKMLENRISHEYSKAEKELQAKFERYMSDFARKDEIKRKEVSEGKITQSEYLTWRRNQLLVGQRWKEMQANLAQDMHTVNMKTASMTRQFSYDAYAMNFNYGTFEAESGSGIDTAFTLYDRSTVERLIRDDPDMLPPPGKRVSRRIAEGKDVLWNKQVIQSVMTQSILQGESIPNIATRLAEAVGDTNRKAAIRNARTMTTGAENAGREDSYKRAESMGIKMQQMWIATLDGRTRHEHRQLDGQKRKVGEPFEVDGQQINFPGDPSAAPYLVWNCRCTLIGIVANSDVEYYKKSMEAAGNIKGNPDMTYDEWKNQHMGKQKNIPAPAPIVPEKSWQDKIKELATSNNITEAEIMQAGKIMQEQIAEVQKQHFDEIKKLEEKKALLTKSGDMDYYSAQYRSARSLCIDLKEMAIKYPDRMPDILYKNIMERIQTEGINISISRDDKVSNIINRLNELSEKCRTANVKMRSEYSEYNRRIDELKVGYKDKLKAKISEVREMGINGLNINSHLTGKSPMKKVVEQAYDYYPTSWIKNSMQAGTLKPKKVDRGYYNHWNSEIAISGFGDERSLQTAIHELGHRFERSQNLRQYEIPFYKRRTDGEELRWLGAGYDKNEKTRFDNFVNAYMGKDYGGSAYELCSMGFEYAYTQPEKLAKDPDMEAWILGILAVG